MEDVYQPLQALMKQYGAEGSPKEFYWAVNTAYHTAESAVYDQMHLDMFEELPPIWDWLANHLPTEPARLGFLDVGCGTGQVGMNLERICPDR